jgi:hypothetical protein
VTGKFGAISARYTGLPAHLIVIVVLTVIALVIGFAVRALAGRRRD